MATVFQCGIGSSARLMPTPHVQLLCGPEG